MSNTKDRIVDAAEQLFARHGVAGTSLRSITQAADVNSAAIHYHFGSKAELVGALIQRRIAPLNERRLKQLEELEAGAQGAAVPIERLISAFLAPVVEARAEFRYQEPQLAGLFAWLRFERDADFARIYDAFSEVRQRYAAAVALSCGDLTQEEADERLGYAVGATFHLLRDDAGGTPALPDDDIAQRFERLLKFLAAGFGAPAGLTVLSSGGPPASSPDMKNPEGARR